MIKVNVRGIVWSGAVLLSQCGTVGDGLPFPGNLPDAWRKAAEMPNLPSNSGLARWWEQFGDAQLNQLIHDAYVANPDLAVTRETLAEVTALRRASEASLFPSLNASANVDRSHIHSDQQSNSRSTTYSGTLEASWEIDWLGKNRNNIAAMRADTAAAAELWHATKVSLSSEIAVAWWALRVNQSRLTVLKQIIATREEACQLANWREKAGQADALESAQAIASLEQARAGISSLAQSGALYQNLLTKLIGRPPGMASIHVPSAMLPAPPPAMSARIPADTIRQRPDLREAIWRCIAAAARSQSTRAEAFPSLRLSGTLGTSTLGSSKVFSPDQVATNLIVGLAGPIFDAGRIRARIAANDAATRRELERFRSTLLNALSEVEDATAACKYSTLRITNLEKSAASARDAAGLAMQRYRSGVTDLSTVLDTQRVLLESEDALLSSQGDLLNAHVQLFRSLGGGW